MSTSNTRRGGPDALGSLLSDLPGVEGDIFSRPKTLGGMRKVKQTPSKPTMSISTGSLSIANASATTFSPSPNNPTPKADRAPQPPSETHSISDLENLLNQNISSSANASSTNLSHDFQDPFADFITSSSPHLTDTLPEVPTFHSVDGLHRDDDPLAMFGGVPAVAVAPPPNSTLDSNKNQHEEDFFADFDNQSNQQQHAQKEEVSAQVTSSNDAPSIKEVERKGEEVKHQRSKSFAERIADSKSSSTAPKTSHKAFQYLDSQGQWELEKNRPSSASDHRPLRTPSAILEPSDRLESSTSNGTNFNSRPHTSNSSSPLSSNQHHSNYLSTESVADITHKAAKALQAGTKWFMRASRQLASEVQSQIEKHRHAGQHSSTHAQNSNRMQYSSSTQSFYHDWAAQIQLMTPETRAAALGAMQEEDRLEVQRILDEAELNNVNNTGNTINQSTPFQNNEGHERHERHEPPPPPSYDEIMNIQKSREMMNESTSAAAATSVRHRQPQIEREGINNIVKEEVVVAPKYTEVKEVVKHVDLLGMDGTPDDDMAFFATDSVNTRHIDDLFTVNQQSAPKKNEATHIARNIDSKNKSTAFVSMIDLGDSLPAVDTSGHRELYTEPAASSQSQGEGGAQEKEPEIRRILREKRIAEKHDRMMRQLAEKRARDEEEDAEKAGKVALRDQLKPKIDGWCHGKKDNIRALLSTMHTVLWEGNDWTAPSISDLVEPGKVKKWYMKANLVVHPDKVKQKGGSLEQVTTADMIFDVLKAAWGKFEASNRQ